MLTTTSQAPRNIDSFKGDFNARWTDFIFALAEEFPDQIKKKAMAIGAALLNKTGRARVGHMFQLDPTTASAYLKELDAADWMPTLEMYAGFKFQALTIPPSATLVQGSITKADDEEEADADTEKENTDTVKKNVGPKRVCRKKETLSDVLAKQGTMFDQRIPDAAFTVIKTPNPALNEIREEEVSDFTDAILSYVAATHGRIDIGAPLARHLMNLARSKIKLPSYGGKAGEERKLDKMLLDKVKNRLYVRCLPACPCPSVRCEHAAADPSHFLILPPAFPCGPQKVYRKKLPVNAVDCTDESLASLQDFTKKFEDAIDVDNDTNLPLTYSVKPELKAEAPAYAPHLADLGLHEQHVGSFLPIYHGSGLPVAHAYAIPQHGQAFQVPATGKPAKVSFAKPAPLARPPVQSAVAAGALPGGGGELKRSAAEDGDPKKAENSASTSKLTKKRKITPQEPLPPPPAPPKFYNAKYVAIELDEHRITKGALVAHWHADKDAWFVGKISALNWGRPKKDYVMYPKDGDNPESGVSFNPKAEYIAATVTAPAAEYGVTWTLVEGQESQA